jgi:hypothetical protein
MQDVLHVPGRMLRIATGVTAVLLWGAVGCHKSSAQGPDAYQNDAQYQGQADSQGQPDYADGNLAPVNGPNTPNEAQQQAEQYGQGAPIERRYPADAAGNYPQAGDAGYARDAGYYDPSYDQDATDQAQAVYEADLTDEEAAEAPPPLPYYEQPEPPDPDYIWTPGYWAWSGYGYYWVPGAWVEPPYVGALWTPGYWAFYSGAYRFHHGFWGLHIGFYGGINYGYGYTGYGYYGGYWRNNHFFYNRAVNHIDPRRINRVYDYRVREASFAGRPSFNGPRGISVRPRPAEVVVLRERRFAPLPAQLELRQQSMQNRQQFFSQNHGRPAMTVTARPVISNHQVPAQLPAWQGGRAQGFRQGDGGFRGVQPGQTQIQPNSQGRVMPQQQGRQPQVQQVQPQVQPQTPAGLGAWQRSRGIQGGAPVQATPQVQPQQQPNVQQQFHRAPDARVNQPPAAVQPAPQVQPQPQPQTPAAPNGWQGRQRGQQAVPVQPTPQVQPQPQPQTPAGLGAWQRSRGIQGGVPVQPTPQVQPQQPNLQQQFHRPDARVNQPAAPAPQSQMRPQPQQEFRRGPEGARMNSQPPAAAQPREQPRQNGPGRGEHNR